MLFPLVLTLIWSVDTPHMWLSGLKLGPLLAASFSRKTSLKSNRLTFCGRCRWSTEPWTRSVVCCRVLCITIVTFRAPERRFPPTVPHHGGVRRESAFRCPARNRWCSRKTRRFSPRRYSSCKPSRKPCCRWVVGLRSGCAGVSLCCD